jgi:hypothetical protein
MRNRFREYRERLVANAFCPKGKGGGIDPTCSPSGASAGEEHVPVSDVVKKVAELFKKTRNPMNGGECGSVARTYQLLNPAFKAYAITTRDPSGEGKGISHLMVSADGGKTFYDGQGKKLTRSSLLKNYDARDNPEVVPAQYHDDPKSRGGGFYKAEGSPEEFDCGHWKGLDNWVRGKIKDHHDI